MVLKSKDSAASTDRQYMFHSGKEDELLTSTFWIGCSLPTWLIQLQTMLHHGGVEWKMEVSDAEISGHRKTGWKR